MRWTSTKTSYEKDRYLMNTAFLSRIPKEKLREMVSLLESRPARSIIEQTNLSLMRSELKVTEIGYLKELLTICKS